MSLKTLKTLKRRSFLTQVGTGVTVLGAGAAVTIPVARAQSVGGAKWEAAKHEQDAWLDQIPGKHRLVFDTTQPAGLGSALQYGGNYYSANQSGYGLQNADLAVVIIARHLSTPFAYNETMWAQYGEQISSFVDRTKEPSKTNTYGRQLLAMTGRGAHLAVCQLATRAIAGSISRAAGKTTDEIFNELVANLLPNSHMVPAGIVVIGRAQEHGYALVNTA
jgi:intracellular sulfur oxidation DsrE/DsrF family protein